MKFRGVASCVAIVTATSALTFAADPPKYVDAVLLDRTTLIRGPDGLGEMNPIGTHYVCFAVRDRVIIGRLVGWIWAHPLMRDHLPGEVLHVEYDERSIRVALPNGKIAKFSQKYGKDVVKYIRFHDNRCNEAVVKHIDASAQKP